MYKERSRRRNSQVVTQFPVKNFKSIGKDFQFPSGGWEGVDGRGWWRKLIGGQREVAEAKRGGGGRNQKGQHKKP